MDMDRKSKIKLLAAACLPLVVAGCAADDCLDNRSSLPLAVFYDSDTDGPVMADMLTVYGVGAPGDSLLYDNVSTGKVYLPFRLDSDTTRYVFKYMQYASASQGDDGVVGRNGATVEDNGVPQDTLTFVYKRLPWFAGVACGAIYEFEIEKVAHTSFAIDRIDLLVDVVDNKDRESFRIYFKSIEWDEDD